MRRAALLVLLLSFPALCLAEEDEKKKRSKPPPPPPGIWWAESFDAGMRRAAQEGRPVLFCINALDTESANLMLRRSQYRSATWGRATRGYVAFPCHPGTENDAKGMSTRYVGTPAKTANDALNYVLKRFGPNQISPQHIILEPDGDVAYRKEYFERVVGPALLDRYLARVSPPVAFSRASIDRAAQLKELAALPDDQLEERLGLLLRGTDGLGGAMVLNLIQDEFGAARRLAMIRAFAKLPAAAGELAIYGAEERISWPDDEPAETLAWVEAILAANPDLGAFAAARAMARAEDRGLRDRIWSAWKQAKSRGKDAKFREREARLLAGDLKQVGPLPSTGDEAERRRIRRAAKVAGLAERRWPDLEDAFRDGRPAVVRGALYEADANEVRAQSGLVEQALNRPRTGRVRTAAALALLRAGAALDKDEVTTRLVQAAFDLVEGPDVRAHIIETLGEDPGEDPDQWTAAIQNGFARGGGR